MGVGAGLYMCDVVKKSSRSLSHLLMNSCLSLAVEALQGKMCQNSLPSGWGRSLGAKISGEGVSPGKCLLVTAKLDTFCYLTMQTAPCYVQSFWHNTGVRQTDGQTDWRTDGQTGGQTYGFAVASTALAMRAVRRAVKTKDKSIEHKLPALPFYNKIDDTLCLKKVPAV